MAKKIVSNPKISVNPSGRIPPDPKVGRGTYRTEDFVPPNLPAPNSSPAGEVDPSSLQGTLNRLKEIASGKIPPAVEK